METDNINKNVRIKTMTPNKSSINSLISADNLKQRFKAGSIPLQSDFSELIDMANIGRMAVGDSGTGKGLSLDNDARLQFDASQIVIKRLNLTNGTGRISYNAKFDDVSSNLTQLIFLAIDATVGPITTEATSTDNFTLLTLPAMKTTNNKSEAITVKIKGSRYFGDTPFPLHTYKGENNNQQPCFSFTLQEPEKYSNCQLTIDPLYLEMRYLDSTESKGTGIFKRIYQFIFDFNGSLQLIPTGLISMFSGSTLPEGWALCDGKNGTPDLQDRFILGGNFNSSGGKSTTTVTGSKDQKQLSFSSDSKSVTISGTTQGHALTSAENGLHNHYIGIATNHTTKALNGYRQLKESVDWFNAGGSGKDPKEYEPKSQNDGSGKAHSHDISLTSGSHTHTNTFTIPYYILAFIMKI